MVLGFLGNFIGLGIGVTLGILVSCIKLPAMHVELLNNNARGAAYCQVQGVAIKCEMH